MDSAEQWDIPDDFDDLIAKGDCQYSILGVVTSDNMAAMRLFVDTVGIPSDKIEVDDGTQIILTHPDPALYVVIDSGGLGDFDRNGYDVAVRPRGE